MLMNAVGPGLGLRLEFKVMAVKSIWRESFSTNISPVLVTEICSQMRLGPDEDP